MLVSFVRTSHPFLDLEIYYQHGMYRMNGCKTHDYNEERAVNLKGGRNVILDINLVPLIS